MAPVSPAFWRLLEVEPLAGRTVLDVGTGRGRLALALAPRAGRVIGLDVDGPALAAARAEARRRGLANVEFVEADAETVDYTPFAPDAVVAHLCMSDRIAERAAQALGPGRPFAFVAFHVDQWRETGRPSRFAYDEARLRAVLGALGFAVEHLEVERRVETFASAEEALARVAALEARWRAGGRWERYQAYVAAGGRQLTRSHLIVKARRR
jgi:SAM-dependent methyltransferase